MTPSLAPPESVRPLGGVDVTGARVDYDGDRGRMKMVTPYRRNSAIVRARTAAFRRHRGQSGLGSLAERLTIGEVKRARQARNQIFGSRGKHGDGLLLKGWPSILIRFARLEARASLCAGLSFLRVERRRGQGDAVNNRKWRKYRSFSDGPANGSKRPSADQLPGQRERKDCAEAVVRRRLSIALFRHLRASS
jgi:hypothetical protein